MREETAYKSQKEKNTCVSRLVTIYLKQAGTRRFIERWTPFSIFLCRAIGYALVVLILFRDSVHDAVSCAYLLAGIV